jgi:hypothetical protein
MIANKDSSKKSSILEFGPVLGSFLGRDIYSWVRTQAGFFSYQGVAPGPRPGFVDTSLLKDAEIAVSPGLLYSKQN